ncbi:GSCOCT00013037001.2-RA-CDS [Cotesia congregata]|uniref:Cc_bv19.3_30.3 n=1 Tax=Cotesia congregata TaxID=51543 RepID=S6CWF0_COTCN|nr:GSCOCG00012614001-RA-CDS [Cotesia congregata]CAD6243332.1 GSCOCT00013037001.2-RA-CDS [Cotesia congregata]CAG5092337.1 cc_bv19.3_30.3 [Cotesia congregata]CCQ71087.1 hypothetical protein BV19-3 [Cotesia congregata]
MMSNKTLIFLFVFILSISWIQAMPSEPETVEDGRVSSLFLYIKNYFTQQSTPLPMTAKDRTLDNSTSRLITSAQEDRSSVAASPAPLSIDDQLRIMKLFSPFFRLKMTQEEQAVAVLSPVVIMLLIALILAAVFFIVVALYQRKSSEKRHDVEQLPIKMSELVK